MKILGIDVGSTTVKAVELDSAFGRYEVQDYYEQKIDPGSTALEALGRLLQGLPKAPDRIAMALPTGQLTFRNLSLPTRDKKSIQSSVGFELDDELPFSLEDCIYDYSILSQSKSGTQLHVAASLKKNLGNALSEWAASGADPDLVTTEAWAYHALFNRIANVETQDHPILLVQIGHERTLLYVHHKGTPVLAREISWGGRDLTLAICQKYQIPLDQAETAKKDHGFVIHSDQKGDVTPEQLEFSNTLKEPIEDLINQIRQASSIKGHNRNTNRKHLHHSIWQIIF